MRSLEKMADESRTGKAGSVSEEDVAVILERYSAETLITLIQEVAQIADKKIDWNAVVKKTATGICSAREYQMLWRHMAYRDGMKEELEEDEKPLDDDSDLEHEIEAFPAVSQEESMEAAAYAKLLIASRISPSDPTGTATAMMEAPVVINIPRRRSSVGPGSSSSLRRKNIAVSVCVQKQPSQFAASMEGLEVGNNGGRKKRRKPWSDAEDMELVASVRKCGEGNWDDIASRGDFKGERTASQLYQRWTTIRRKHVDVSQNGGPMGRGQQLSEAQLAARRAMSMAISMPIWPSGGGGSSNPAKAPPTARAGSRKPPPAVKTCSPDSMVKAAAVAAGARIVTQHAGAAAASVIRSAGTIHMMGPSRPSSAVHFIPPHHDDPPPAPPVFIDEGSPISSTTIPPGQPNSAPSETNKTPTG